MTNGAELKLGDRASAKLTAFPGIDAGLKLQGVYHVEAHDKHGNFKWRDYAKNVVTTTGIQHIMGLLGNDTTIIATWYLGLLSDTTITTTDIIGTIGGEATEYTGSRKTWSNGLTVNTLSNTDNLATFTMDKDGTTVEGCFLCSSNTNGGSAGILLSGAPFAGGSKTGDSGDVLTVTYKLVGSDDTSS